MLILIADIPPTHAQNRYPMQKEMRLALADLYMLYALTYKTDSNYTQWSHKPNCCLRCKEEAVSMKWLVIVFLVGTVSSLDVSPEGKTWFSLL